MTPCMSCGGDRNEPPRDGCLYAENHHSSPGWKQITAERERWWNGRQWTETYRERKTE